MAYTAKTAAALRRESGSLLQKVASELSLIDTELEAVAAGERALADGRIFVGNGAGVATAVAVSGDVTIANTGAVTIANEAVTVAKMADLARGSIIVGTGADNRPAALDANDNGKILVGDGNDLNSVAVSGDVTLSNAGVVSIGANKITSAMLAPGVMKVAKVPLVAGNANAFAFAWQNPESTAIFVREVILDVTTQGGTGGSLMNIGSAADGTTGSDNLIDGADINSVDTYSNHGTGAGTNGKPIQKVAANGGAADYVTGQILVANAGGLVGNCYIFYTAV